MRKKTKAQLRSLLLHAVIVFAFVTTLGVISNILLLLVSYIIALPHLFEFLKGYYMNLDNQKLWLLYAVVSQTACTIGCGVLLRYIGASAARFRLSNHFPAERVSIPVMAASVGIGVAAHGTLCALVARLSMAYLFFAAPVPYIARFLGRGDRTLFSDLAFRFPYRVVLFAILIYMILLFVGGCIGYRAGYKKQVAAVYEAEEERGRGTPPEKTWSLEDAKQIPSVWREK